MASKLGSKRQSASEDKHCRDVTSWQQQTIEGVVVGGPWGHNLRLRLREEHRASKQGGAGAPGAWEVTLSVAVFTMCKRKLLEGLSCRWL